MGDTSQGQLALVKETVAGTTPATPAFKVLDFVSENLVMNANSVRSQAVTPNRVVKGARRTSKSTGGGINLELYKGAEIDEILAALMGNAFAGDPLTAKAGGIVEDSFTFERKLSATDYRRFMGVRIGSADFAIAPEQLITMRLNTLGRSKTSGATIITGATYAPATETEKLTSLDVAAVTLAGDLTGSFDYEQINFTVNNQLGLSNRIGPNPVRRVRAGQALVTGNMRIYIDDDSVFAAFNDDDARFSMDVPMLFGGEGYTALFKNVAILSYDDSNPGNNNEFMANVEFEATLEGSFASSFAFSKIEP